jgi:hypothetical protein
MEFVQELLRIFVKESGGVWEEIRAERARRQMAEQRAAALETELEAPREPRESPQTVDEELERARAAAWYFRVSGGRTEAVVA